MTLAAILRPRVIAVWLALSVLVLTPEIVAVRSAFDPRPTCEITAEWVQQHSANLPTGYDDFIAFPDTYRRAMLHKLTPKQQSALWATHLERALTQSPELNADQRRWLGEIVHRLRRTGLPKPDSAEYEAMGNEITQYFGGSSQLRLFTQLGPDRGSYSRNLGAAWLNFKDAVRSSIVANAESGDCNCRTTDDWCPAHYSGPGYAWCEDPEEYNWCPSCQERWGCGWWLLGTCDGMCSHCIEAPPGSGEWACGCG